MNISQFINSVNDQMQEMVDTMAYLPSDEIGLDRRAAYRVWIDKDVIIVTDSDDATLQYYGGFQYVEKSCRVVLGNYVIYSNNSDRVQECIDYWLGIDVDG